MLHPLTRSFFFQVNFRFDPGCITFLLLKCVKESFLNQLSSVSVRGASTAPGGQPSIYGDVYSFRVLLEMFTRKRPTNDFLWGDVSLHSYTKLALQNRVLDIADKSVLNSDLRVGFPVSECFTLIVEVGLNCCEESPASEHGIRVNICQGEVLSSQMRSQKLKSFCFYLIASHIKY
ncbi:unnamed protein product [Brassica oleracea var. botrytis]